MFGKGGLSGDVNAAEGIIKEYIPEDMKMCDVTYPRYLKSLVEHICIENLSLIIHLVINLDHNYDSWFKGGGTLDFSNVVVDMKLDE